MKRLFSILSAMVLTMSLWAQSGATCDDAIYVDGEYVATFAEGEYWFTALTSQLPMSIVCYPSNPGAKAPEIQVDFTCTYEDGVAVYDDEKVAKMVANAGKYGLTLPMTKKLDLLQDDQGKLFYRYTFPKNYQNMLYGQGVTYAIPAYVRLKVFGNTSVDIASEATASRCRDYVNALGMNTTLLFAPEDSVNTYVWPVGEWIKHKYEITWQGQTPDSRLLFLTSKDCEFDRFSTKVRNRYSLPASDEAHELKMTPEASSELVEDIFQTELYVRMYATTPGNLIIKTYEDVDNITDYLVGGVAAVVDNENMTISAVLPAGTNRNEAIKNAKYRPIQTHDGHQAEYDNAYTRLIFGKLVYDITGIVVGESDKNTDASLKSFSVNDIAYPLFSPATLDYFDYEISGDKLPQVTAEARRTTSTVSIEQATTVPGKAIITVTAEAGNKQVYTVSFIRQRSRDNKLKALYVDGKLIPGFRSDSTHYRLEVKNLPQLTAELSDEKATMQIDQPKRVPGLGQVIVTAESGDVEVYSVTFVLSPEMKQCSNSTVEMESGKAITLDANTDEVLRLPVKAWAGKDAVISWTGSEDLGVDFMSTCLDENNVTFDHQDLVLEKGETVRRCYLTTTQTLRWKREGIDGYVYLKFNNKVAGDISIAPFSPDCRTRSDLMDLNQEYKISTSDFSKIFKLYLPDWQYKDVEIKWVGNSTFELFIADVCDFYLVTTNAHIMRQGNGEGYASLSSGQSMLLTREVLDLWQRYQRAANSDDFVYARFNTGAAGTLTVTVKKEYECPDCTPKTFHLTLLAEPAEGGVLTGEGDYEPNTDATFSATANPHYTFRSWSDGNANNPRTVRMTKDQTFTAVFVADKHKLTLSCDPAMGTVSGAGTYAYGTDVLIEAKPLTGYEFVEWSDDNQDNPRLLHIDGDISLEATFQKIGDAVEDLNATTNNARKVIINGQIYILRNGKTYNMLGSEI